MGLGAKLKELRKRRFWTQERLGEESGLGRSYISQLELDNIAEPPARAFLKLAAALHVNLEELLDAAGYDVVKGERDVDPEFDLFFSTEAKELNEEEVGLLRSTIRMLSERVAKRKREQDDSGESQ